MKIRRVDVYPFDIPLKAPFRIATMVTDVAPNILVRIETDDGRVGWGEGSPLHSIVGETQGICLACAREYVPFVLGRDPRELVALAHDMYRFMPHNSTTACAFDIAFHDLAAQEAGQPLYRFLGGTKQPLPTGVTISIVPAEQAFAEAQEIVASGFPIVKIKLGGNPAADVARVAAVREAVGESIKIRVDANQGWDRVTAVEVLQAIEVYDIEFCEQPLRAGDLDGMRWVGERTGIPIMADESLFGPESAIELVKREACPYFNIKLTKSRGIVFGTRIAGIAEAAGIKCMVGAMVESPLALTAIAHFGTTSPAMRFWDLDTTVGQRVNPCLGGATLERGCVYVPEEPGLGCSPDPDFLKNLTPISV